VMQTHSLRPYVLLFRRPHCWPRTLDVMATDTVTAASQHACLCAENERVEAMTPQAASALLARLDHVTTDGSPAYMRALRAQQQQEANAGRLWVGEGR
jgi:hypothetical protein